MRQTGSLLPLLTDSQFGPSFFLSSNTRASHHQMNQICSHVADNFSQSASASYVWSTHLFIPHVWFQDDFQVFFLLNRCSGQRKFAQTQRYISANPDQRTTTTHKEQQQTIEISISGITIHSMSCHIILISHISLLTISSSNPFSSNCFCSYIISLRTDSQNPVPSCSATESVPNVSTSSLTTTDCSTPVRIESIPQCINSRFSIWSAIH